jgi:Tfp pilus assembly protein PilV
MRKQISSTKQGGFSILEVVIGIFIFIVGMLALAALQGALTRSTADAKLRTTAANLADLTLERQRGFTILQTDPAGVLHAYNDIVSDDDTLQLNGVTYSIDMDVTDYYYDLSTDYFSTTAPLGATSSNYKQVEVTVSWDAVQDFRADEGSVITANDINTGSVTLTGAIPALITSSAGRVSDETTGGTATPPISYTPGQRPDIVSLTLGDNKFKESLLPEPDVIRVDELVETRFDVITYSGTGNSAQFLRREEFAVVSCECTLRAADADNQGRRPVVWAGDEYLGGQFVTKPYGESANNQQSELCVSCCRDHHDGGTSTEDHATDDYYNVYGPFKADSEYVVQGQARKTSDHKHYKQDGTTEAGVGETYLEACRAVRVDGFLRMTQDFRREDQYIFPADFLDEEAEIDVYSGYTTGAVSAYYGAASDGYPTALSVPCIGGPSPCVKEPNMQGDSPTPLDLDNNEFPSWTSLPFGQTNARTQQLRSRGIFIDYMSNDLRAVMACLAAGGNEDTCKSGDVELDKTGSVNALEILPFFEVQQTLLDRWNETPTNVPVDTTNQSLADGNTHSRGVISSSTDGSSTIDARGHRGNLGFTDTPAIDPVYSNYVTNATLGVQAGTGGVTEPPPSGDPVIAGSLTESVSGQVTITVSGNDSASCGQTGAAWSCEVPVGSTSASVTISGYGKINKTHYACASGLSIIGTPVTDTGATTTFNLVGVTAGTSYTINIQETACTGI